MTNGTALKAKQPTEIAKEEQSLLATAARMVQKTEAFVFSHLMRTHRKLKPGETRTKLFTKMVARLKSGAFPFKRLLPKL